MGGQQPLSKSGSNLPRRPPPPPPGGSAGLGRLDIPGTSSLSSSGSGSLRLAPDLSASQSPQPLTAKSAPGSYSGLAELDLVDLAQYRSVLSGPPSVNHDLANGLEALYVSTSRTSVGSSLTGNITPSPLSTPTGMLSPEPTASPMALRGQSIPEVDGLSQSVVDSWFRAADTDGDGKLAGSEAVAFFQMTGLSKKELSLIWAFATDNKPGGLDRSMFSIALRLVALAQSGQPLTPDTAALATRPSPLGPKLPAPALQMADSGSGRGAPPAPAAVPPAQRPSRPRAPSPLSVVSLPAAAEAASGTPMPVTPNAELSRNLLSLEVRLVPLTPKQAGRTSAMAAASGGLLVGVRGTGAARLFQWGRAEGNIRAPEGAQDAVPAGEDADMAPASDVHDTSLDEVCCIHVDEISQVIWTGHKDGCIACWRLGPSGSACMQRMHSWKGHRSRGVIALATTFRGDLWSGSRMGTIRVWSRAKPGELPDGRLSRELRRVASQRAHMDQLHRMALSSTGQVVWSIGLVKAHIWEASSGKFLATLGNVSNMSGMHSGGVNNLNVKEGLPMDKDGWIETGGIQRCQSADEALDFLAMDRGIGTVRNVAEAVAVGGVKTFVKGTEHAKKGLAKLGKTLKNGRSTTPERVSPPGLEEPTVAAAAEAVSGSWMALTATWQPAIFNMAKDGAGLPGRALSCMAPCKADGSFWLGYRPGLIERYAPNGRLLWEEEVKVGVRSIAAVGMDIWAGLMDGSIIVYNIRGQRRAAWSAHRGPIVSLVVAGTRVFSMGINGTIIGWSAAVPDGGPIAWSSGWHVRLQRLIQRRTLTILAGTWNVNEKQPSQASLNTWLGNRAKRADMVMVGLQEIEMGSGSVAQAAFMDKLSLNEKGNTNAAWWKKSLLQALASLESEGLSAWCPVALRQLSGMLVLVFVRKELFDYVGMVSTDSVGCGVLGVGGNKGAVAVGFSIFRNYLVCVNSHFAAHQKDVEKRNDNYAQICQTLVLRSGHKTESEAEAPEKDKEEESALDPSDLRSSEERTIQDSDAVIWVGDFNYRVDMERDEVVERVKEDDLGTLMGADQCRREMAAGRAFVGLQEGAITFPPTYKFDKNAASPYAYDSSEKRRVPSWTDRIFFRGSARRGSENPLAVAATSTEYNTCMNVIDSDHKPVFSFLSLDIPVVDMTRKRREASHMLKQCLAEQGVKQEPATGVALEPAEVQLSGSGWEAVRLSNSMSEPVEFSVMGSSGALSIPLNLSVFPVRGIVPANGAAELLVRLTEFEDQSYIHESFTAVLTVLFERIHAEGSDGRISRAVGKQINVAYSTR